MEKKGRYEKLKNGNTLYTDTMGDTDFVVMQGGGNSIHIYIGGELDNNADVDVCLYDNIHIEIHGKRKQSPTLVVRGGEFPCTLVLAEMDNVAVIDNSLGGTVKNNE